MGPTIADINTSIMDNVTATLSMGNSIIVNALNFLNILRSSKIKIEKNP